MHGWENLLHKLEDVFPAALRPSPGFPVQTQGGRHEALLSAPPVAFVPVTVVWQADTASNSEQVQYRVVRMSGTKHTCPICELTRLGPRERKHRAKDRMEND